MPWTKVLEQFKLGFWLMSVAPKQGHTFVRYSNNFQNKRNFVLRLKRVHNTGTQTILSQSTDGWRINIDLREANHNPVTIVGYLQPTLEKAKQVADQEILKHGHVCGADCKEWGEFVSAVG